MTEIQNAQGVRRIKLAGILNTPIRTGNYKQRNFQETAQLIRKAAQEGAQLACTFEQFLDGYGYDANKIATLNDANVDRCEIIDKSKYVKDLANLAAELKIAIVAGLAIREAERTYNSALIFSPTGKLIGQYRKTHNAGKYATWFAPLTRKQKKDNCPSFDLGPGRIGLKICNDRHFRETTAYLNRKWVRVAALSVFWQI